MEKKYTEYTPEMMIIDKFRVMQDLRNYGLKKHTGNYTLGFMEDNIEFCYNSHDTGKRLTIYLNLGTERLEVFHDEHWGGNYVRHYDGKVFGYLEDGPWIDLIEKKFADFFWLIEEKKKEEEIKKKEQQEKLEKEKEEKRARFVEAFGAQNRK